MVCVFSHSVSVTSVMHETAFYKPDDTYGPDDGGGAGVPAHKVPGSTTSQTPTCLLHITCNSSCQMTK